MDKRQFLKFALLSPLLLKMSCNDSNDLLEGDVKSFDYLEVSGDYFEIGTQIGKKIAGTLRLIIEERKQWFSNLSNILNSSSGQQYSNILYEKTENLFPHFISELKGISEGSNQDFDTIWLFNIRQELSNLFNQENSSSSVYYKDNDNFWLLHNLDLDKAFIDRMLMVKVNPPSGVSFYSLIAPGNIAGVAPAMNNKGICHAMNPISCLSPELGIPRNILCRAIIESKSLSEAVENSTIAPRTLPAHHNILSMSKKTFASVETLPRTQIQVNFLEKDVFIHTNHLVGDKVIENTYEDTKFISQSSLPRFKALQTLISSTELPIERSDQLLRMIGSHVNKPMSPCLHFNTEASGNTIATTFFDVKTKKMRVYKGNPCKSAPNDNYCEYSF